MHIGNYLGCGASDVAYAGKQTSRKLEEKCATGLRVETGRFQQYMQVEIYNDGPVTILLDSRE